ncbi:MAG: thiol reductant ABC exporter subunit CydC [Desertimonas sp.]
MAVGSSRRTRTRAPLDPRLLRRFPALRAHLVVCAVAALVLGVVIVAQAEVLARGIARMVGASDRGPTVGALAVALLVIGVVRATTGAVIERSAARTMARLRTDMVGLVVDAAIERSAPPEPHAAGLIAADGPRLLEPYVRSYLPALAQAVVIPLAAGGRILTLDLLSAVVIAITVPLIPVFMVLIGEMTERRERRSWATMRRLGQHFDDVLTGLPTLRLFGRARRQAESVRAVAEDYRRSTMSMLKVAFLSALTLELCATLSVALVAVEVGLRMAAGGVALTTGLIILLLVPDCYVPLRRIGAGFHAAQNGMDAADDARAAEEPPPFPVGTATPDRDANALVLRGLSLRVGDRVLDYDDRVFTSGAISAITGPSGSGKTTLLHALRGRALVAGGAVSWGGVDLAELDPMSWAELVTWLPQRPFGASGTVADEVRGGRELPDAVVADVLARVGLVGVEERSLASLSGGERRRALLAHCAAAVIAGPARVVILDEPTAQLDADAAALVVTLLRDVAACGAVVVVATHDPMLAAVADAAGPRRPSVEDPSPGEGRPDVGRSDVAASDVVPAADPPVGMRDAWRALRRRVEVSPSRVGLAIGLGLVAEASTLGLAGVAAWLLLRASEQPSLGTLGVAVVAVRAFGVGKGAGRYAERLASHDAGLRALARLRGRLIGRLAMVEPTRTSTLATPELVRRTVDDVDALLDLLVRTLIPWVTTALAVGGVVAFTCWLDPAAALVSGGLGVVVVVVVPWWVARGELMIVGPLRHARGELAGAVATTVAEIELLIDRGRTAEARRVVDGLVDTQTRLDEVRARHRVVVAVVGALAPPMCVAITAWVIPASLGRPILGVLMLWPLAVFELAATAGDAAEGLAEGAVAARRIDELFALPGEPEPASHAESRPGPAVPAAPVLAVDALRAQWRPQAPLIGPISLGGDRGERVAVRGPSGAGKSTIAAALVDYCPNRAERFEVGGRGRVELGGPGLRSMVTWVDQQPWIADTSVANNLRIADPTATDDRLLAALAVVSLDTWVARRPDGLEALVGRNGARLSGGEAHRLALARVVLAAHAVVVLDEPCSHLDVPTATVVARRLDVALGDRLVIELGHHAGVGLVERPRTVITVDHGAGPAQTEG